MTLQAVNAGKVRTAASSLASEQMEKLRNLPYDQLTTQHGTILPQGNIPDTQTITRSSTSFTLKTTIIIVDDPLDGCAISDPVVAGLYDCTDGGTSTTRDFVPVDYKRISISVNQVGSEIELAKHSSDVAARAAETPSNTGMLLVIVNDAEGLPLEGATVTVTHSVFNLNIVALTNAQGYVFIANITPDNHNGYHIVATENGYSTDMTTSRTSQNPNQDQPDVDVNIQQVTTQTLSIDKLAHLSISVVNQNSQPVSGLNLSAVSSKTVEHNPARAKNTYTAQTNGAGLVNFGDVEWDSYNMTLPNGYYVISSSPYAPILVNPDDTIVAHMMVTQDSNWPRLESVNPSSGVSGTAVEILIQGNNFNSDSTVVLRRVGYSDLISSIIVVAPDKKSITVTFPLTGATGGAWDIVITTGGKTLIEQEGFIIS